MSLSQQNKTIFKVFMLLVLCIFAIFGIIGRRFYIAVYKPNVNTGNKDTTYLFIPSYSNFDKVLEILKTRKLIKDTESFTWLSSRKNYTNNIKPGKYLLRNKMNNNELVNLLRSGKQTPVKLIFNNIRTIYELSSVVSKRIEADSISIVNQLEYEKILDKIGLTPQNCLVLFIPNTYEFFWNTSAETFINKMYKEYKKFWNSNRISKARAIGLTPIQVSILASIVQAEQARFNNEKPKIAGLYINRLNKGMLLQSDPTLIYALNNFRITRVLNRDTLIDSPYNTYKYYGLPPGPINLPEISSIDAVLNYEQTDYIYMCAKEDLSGLHNFSKTIDQHLIYARKYQQALDIINIKR